MLPEGRISGRMIFADAVPASTIPEPANPTVFKKLLLDNLSAIILTYIISMNFNSEIYMRF
jgi:hypothetical protein